ncbi:hypothetical protein Patl1_25777 [Pistacia atlantica]|uniref:Uncharacterized protein n=1 Tax=Pistacia atlantica TaxID=434234 RepID=A0ACC1AZ08_9ROSI|nr:hypothetical protein Patl1_25777 [Pistacia atlantica]
MSQHISLTITHLYRSSIQHYAFLTEKTQFSFSSTYLHCLPKDQYPMVLDWSITGHSQCEETKKSSSYACKEYSECYVREEYNDSSGYLCKCKKGYQGNPYLSHSCQDIDECSNPDSNDCPQTCINEEGSYTCKCHEGFHGDGRKYGEGCIVDVDLPSQFPLVKVALALPEHQQNEEDIFPAFPIAIVNYEYASSE